MNVHEDVLKNAVTILTSYTWRDIFHFRCCFTLYLMRSSPAFLSSLCRCSVIPLILVFLSSRFGTTSLTVFSVRTPPIIWKHFRSGSTSFKASITVLREVKNEENELIEDLSIYSVIFDFFEGRCQTRLTQKWTANKSLKRLPSLPASHSINSLKFRLKHTSSYIVKPYSCSLMSWSSSVILVAIFLWFSLSCWNLATISCWFLALAPAEGPADGLFLSPDITFTDLADLDTKDTWHFSNFLKELSGTFFKTTRVCMSQT